MPVIALFTCGRMSTSFTAPWHWLCGTADLWVVVVPATVVAFVVAAGAVARRAPPSFVVPTALVAIGVALCTAAIALGAPAAPTGDALLRASVHTLGTLAPADTMASIAGTQLSRACDPYCSVVVDGIDATQLSDASGPIELAEGLAYRFVRVPVSAPSTCSVASMTSPPIAKSRWRATS